MRRISFIFLALFTLLAQTSMAGETALKCPSPSPELSKLVSRLIDFRSVLNDAPKCTAIAKKIEMVTEVTGKSGREKLDNILKGISGKNLTPAQIKDVSAYAESAGNAVLELVELINKDNECVSDKEKPSLLATVASITQQVTSVTSSFSGPYGMPIAVGGAAFAGVLSGIDKYMAAHKGYDFKNEVHRKLFVANFCSYSELRKEATYLANPSETIGGLIRLQEYLNQKQSDLIRNCPECLMVQKAHEDKDLLSGTLALESQAVANLPKGTAELCASIADISTDSDGNLAKINQIIAKSTPMSEALKVRRSDLLQIFADSKLESRISLASCLANPGSAELAKQNAAFISLLNVYLSASKTYSELQLSTAIGQADSGYKEPLGTYTVRTIETLAWTEAQLDRLRKLTTGQGSALYDINALITELDERIYSKIAPAYLKWMLDASANDFEGFRQGYADFSKVLSKAMKQQCQALDELRKKDPNFLSDFKCPSTTPEILKAIRDAYGKPNMNFPDSSASIMYSGMAKVGRLATRAIFALVSVGEYCKFISQTGGYSSPVMQLCEGPLVHQMTSMEEIIKGLSEFTVMTQWLRENKKVDGSWVQELSEHIKYWNERKDKFDPKPR